MTKHRANYSLMKLVYFFILSLIFVGCKDAPTVHRIIPMPQSIDYTGNSLKLSKGALFYTNLEGLGKSDLANYLELSPLGLKLAQSASDADVIFDIVPSLPDSLNVGGAYMLSINKNKIEVEAKNSAGLFYAVQSLLQLADIHTNGTIIFPTVEIADAPRFEYRGLHLDVSRHFYPKEFIKKQLDAMARYKLNNFHWHLTDGAGWRLEIEQYPELTSTGAFRPYKTWKEWWTGGRKYCDQNDPNAEGGYYTKEDVKEIVEYARQRHINVIPEIEMPAHSEEVVAIYPQLSCTGKPYTSAEFCIGNEETFEFLENVLSETISMFPSDYIHIGGDEADKRGWAKCKKCQRRMKEEGLKDVDELQSYLIHRIQAFLETKNKQMIGWDEILEGGLAPNAVVMSWRGENGGIEAVKKGHSVIMTPAEFCYFDAYQDAPVSEPEAIGGYLTLDKVYSYNPIPEEVKERGHLIKGVQANTWTEYITTTEHVDHMIYPRLLALAEVAWTDVEKKDWESFREGVLKETVWLQANGYTPFDLNNEIGERKEAQTPVEHLAKSKKVIYNSPYSHHYAAAGDSSLTDGLRGGWSYHDKRWQGFLNTNFDVVVDLEKQTDITSVTAEFLQLSGPYIWLPKDVTISISDDGIKYTELTKIENELPTTYDKYIVVPFGWEGNAKGRYVRYQATSCGIDGGWLFTDEIVIK